MELCGDEQNAAAENKNIGGRMGNEEFFDALVEFDKQRKANRELEFVVDESFVEHLPEILSNIETIKKAVAEQTETDRTLILQTDEDFERARKRCAELNKINTQIDDQRKRVKREYIKPYELFDKALKETTAIITEAKDNLWGQIKAAEDAVKEQKETEYKEYYCDAGEHITPYRSWEQIFKKEWLNKGYSKEKVRDEINDIIKEVMDDLEAIDNLKSEFHTSLIDKYRSGATLKEVIAYQIALQDAKMSEERRKGMEQATSAQNAETRTDANVAQENGIEDETITADFRVTCTRKQLKELKNFLIWNNIQYGKVPKGE